jgi:hypothetical protein
LDFDGESWVQVFRTDTDFFYRIDKLMGRFMIGTHNDGSKRLLELAYDSHEPLCLEMDLSETL